MILVISIVIWMSVRIINDKRIGWVAWNQLWNCKYLCSIDLARNKNQIGYDLYKEIILNFRKQSNTLDTQKIEEYLQYFVNGDKIFEIIQDEVF